MGPLMVTAVPALLRRGRVGPVTLQPVLDDVVIELLGPQHARKALAHNILCIRGKVLRNDGGVKLIGFALTQRESLVETDKRILAFEVRVRKAHPDYYRFSYANCELVMGSGLGAAVLRIDRVLGAVHDVVVDAIFYEGSAVLGSEQPPDIGLVFSEQQFRRTFAMKPAIARLSMVQLDHRVGRRAYLVQLRPPIAASPRPRVAEPHSG